MGRNLHWSLIVASKDGRLRFARVDPTKVVNSDMNIVPATGDG
jgi:hypothetical protein